MEATYKKSKGSAGHKGVQFQLDLVTICLLNAFRNHKNWKISSENPIGGKYDDIVVELVGEAAILIQAKHKENRKITKDQLLSDNSKNADFSLSKYFFSYEEIKRKFPTKTVIICTNTAINTKGLEEILTSRRAHPDSVLYHESDCSFYTFNENILPDLKKSTEAYLDSNLRDKGVDNSVITEKNLKDFLQNLQFFSCYPCEDYLHRIIEESLSRLNCSSLCRSISSQEILRKVEDWFKQPKGEYLTEARTKAMLCEIRSDKYCESLKGFHVSFARNDFDIIALSGRIIHIEVKDGHMLQILKVYYAVRGDKSKKLYVNPDDAVEVQKNVVEAFGLSRYKFLIMAWDAIKDDVAKREIIDKLKEVLQKNEHKKVILVADTDAKLTQQFGPEHINKFHGSAAFHDLSENSQEMLLKKDNIIFQGDRVNLQELLRTQVAVDYTTFLDSTMLEELVRGTEIKVGVRPLVLDKDIDRYYVSRKFLTKIDERRSTRTLLTEDITRNALTEESLYDVKEKMIAISESAGMGKSTVLTKMAGIIKESNPSLWVMKINLNDYTSALRDFVKANRSKVTAAELLNSLEATKMTNEFEELVFSMSGKVVLMLDGVDEISPDYTDLALSLLSHCQEALNFTKIFVTTRPHVDLKLSETEQFTMLPFSESEQIDFLTEYWLHNLNLSHEHKEKCEWYATILINNIFSWTTSGHYWQTHFTAMPLQMRMLAEIFQENIKGQESGDWEGCKEYVEKDEDEIKLPKKFNIAELYDLFVQKKRDVFVEKSSGGNVTATPALLNQFESCLAYHRSLAISILVSEGQELFKINIPENKLTEEYIFKIGIVQKLDGRIQFIHRTFAEYFLADCIVQVLKFQEPDAEFQELLIDTILLDDQFEIVRSFLDILLQKGPLPPNIFKQYRSMINRESNSKTIFKLAEEGHVAILRLMLENVQFKVIKGRSIDVTDWRLRLPFRKRNTLNDLAVLVRTAGVNIKNDWSESLLELAVKKDHVKMVSFLAEQGADVNVTHDGESSLVYSAANGGLDIVASLVEHGFDINMKAGSTNCTALHIACIFMNWDIVKYLVEHGADINMKNSNSDTSLHLAIYAGNWNIVKYLIHHGAEVNTADDKGLMVVHAAAKSNKLDIIEYLLENGVDINIRDSNDDTSLHEAVRGQSCNVVKYLVEHGADVNARNCEGLTSFNMAAKYDKVEIIEYLLEHGADPNMKDSKNNTALHVAVCGKNWKVVKYLVAHDADINARNAKGFTALHMAAKYDEVEIVEYILENSAEINAINYNYYYDFYNHEPRTPLSIAIHHQNWNIVKCLLDHGATVDTDDTGDFTVLHVAAILNRMDIAEYGLEHGAFIDKTDRNRNTALHVAICGQSWNVAKYLVAHGADVNARNREGLTALHIAARYDEVEIVDYILGHGALINMIDMSSNTALHVAIRGQSWNVAKFLVEHGASVNARNNEGLGELHMAAKYHKVGLRTPLSIAIHHENWNIVKCLLDHGATVDTDDTGDFTVLHEAAILNRMDIAEYNLKLGAFIDNKDRNRNTALQVAICGQSWNVTKYLIAHGADVNYSNHEGLTALHMAAKFDEIEIVEYILGYGADINTKDSNGSTALNIAVRGDNWNVVMYLAEHGADVSTINDHFIALH